MTHLPRELHAVFTLAVSSIAYVRNFYAIENFGDIEYDGIKFKCLSRGITSEADRFLDRVENIVHCINKGYVHTVQLGISLVDDPGDLSEVYVFEFSNNINHCDDIGQCLKDIILETQSFHPLPYKKIISFKVLFNETCPRDYQLSRFHDASQQYNSIFIDAYPHRYKGFGCGNIGVKLMSNTGKLDSLEIDFLHANVDDSTHTKIDFSLAEPELTCECDLHHPQLDNFSVACTKCHRQCHIYCYGLGYRTMSVTCHTCKSTLDQFEAIIKLRAIYKMMNHKSLNINSDFNINDPMTVNCINFMLKKRIMVLSELQFKANGEPFECFGSFHIYHQLFYDDRGNLLTPGYHNFIFSPKSNNLAIPYSGIGHYLKTNNPEVLKNFHLDFTNEPPLTYNTQSSIDSTLTTDFDSLLNRTLDSSMSLEYLK